MGEAESSTEPPICVTPLGTMRRLRHIVASPALYAAWALFVLGTLTAAYFADPYIFAFTTMILGGISVGIGFTGLAVALFSKGAGWRTRTFIIVSVALAVAAVVVALEILRTFKWA